MPYKIQYLPKELLELNEETAFHPKLMENLAEQQMGEIEQRLACIAAYCQIVMDGYYTVEDQLRLAAICTQKLKEQRYKTVLILQ